MQKYLMALALAALPISVFPGDVEDSIRVKIGESAPEVIVKTIDGKDVHVGGEKAKGTVTLIDLFAVWCGPCMQAMPRLEKEIWLKHKDRKDFAMVAVGRGHNADELGKFAKEKGFTLPFAADPDKAIYSKFADKYIPRTILVGKDGTIRYLSVGYDEKEFAALLEAVQAELDKK